MSYLGSKAASGAYQAVIASMPPHDTYIEPFVGSGAIFLRKPRAQYSIVIDADPAATANLPMLEGDDSVSVHTCDALHYLRALSYKGLRGFGRVFIYCDPPYLWSTRTSNKRYAHEFSEADHLYLLGRLAMLSYAGAQIAISGYPSEMYDEELADWNSIEYQVMTRGGPRTEKLWMNYELDAAFSSAYAGSNFTDRQRIKRKAQRWAKNFSSMPAGERMAVMSAMLEAVAE